MHNASRQVGKQARNQADSKAGKASHDARRDPRIVLLRRFHRDEDGGENVADADLDPDDDEVDGADVDEEEKIVDDDA